jgi:hypothetical protein
VYLCSIPVPVTWFPTMRLSSCDVVMYVMNKLLR